ncbi:MAG TPA: cell division protein ZapA [Candidatus Alistipes merdigallinarum]|nr:cell division protein ZapA [Candidatus Alistipes merdigallinarum]
MAGKRRIKLKVIGKEYPMTILQNEEEKFRRAAQDLNALISVYKTRFAAEPEDYLAMAAIQIAADKVGLEMDRELSDEKKALTEIEQTIDNYLNKI